MPFIIFTSLLPSTTNNDGCNVRDNNPIIQDLSLFHCRLTTIATVKTSLFNWFLVFLVFNAKKLT
jgi:hypothetical protein